MQEYKRLCAEEIIAFCDYKEYSSDLVKEVFGEEIGAGILEETKFDAAIGVTGEMLKTCWTEICNEIANLPNEEKLEEICSSLGVKSKLSDIDVPDEKVDKLLSYSPMVRSRLTFMRLRKCM